MSNEQRVEFFCPLFPALFRKYLKQRRRGEAMIKICGYLVYCRCSEEQLPVVSLAGTLGIKSI